MQRRSLAPLQLLIGLLAALVVFTAVPARPAHASVSQVELAGAAWDADEIWVGEVSTLTFEITSKDAAVAAVGVTIQLPAGGSIANDVIATKTSSGANDCVVSNVSYPSTSISFTINVPAGLDGYCSIWTQAQFDTSGDYTPSDFAATTTSPGGTDTTGWTPSLLVKEKVVDDEVSDEPPAPAFCSELPDLAVSPQYIEIAPGGRATVELAMRNLCPDLPFDDSDLLISFSDGLTVVDTSGGMVGMGQRAADQRFMLAAGETKRWTVTVQAGASLATAPVHITEHFVTGYAPRRIDGVFITPAPAPAAAPEAPAPAPAPAPAALPVTLPNTGGAGDLLPVVAAALGLLAVGGATLRRRR